MQPRVENLWFVVARLVGVAVRPVVLLIALNFGNDVFAKNYALIITAITSSFVIYANQNHRGLYNLFLDRSLPPKGLRGKNAMLHYLDGVATHMAIFTPIVMVLVWLWVESPWLCLLTLPLVMIEKYYDDHQRALIYKRAYSSWSRHFLFRLILPNTFVLIIIIGFGSANIAIYTASSVACFLVYIIFIDQAFLSLILRWMQLLRKPETSSIKQRVEKYAKEYLAEYLGAQVFTILAINLVLIDRYFVKGEFPEVFAQYIFAVNVFGMVSVFHNIFHFTQIRGKLISQNYPVIATVFSLRNFGTPAVFALGALMSFPLLQMLGIYEVALEWDVLVALASVHFTAAVTLVLKEFAFWRVKRHWLVLMDGIVIATISLFLLVPGQSLTAIPMMLAIGLVIRGIALGCLCSTRNAMIRM